MDYVKKFIRHVEQETAKHKVKLTLAEAPYVIVAPRTRGNGFFDEEHMELACSCGKPRKLWLPILVHEYSHFEQWRDQCRAWTGGDLGNKDSSGEMFAWISGKRLPKRLVHLYVTKTRQLELDCEKRALKNIKKFKLPLDAKAYCQRANSYIHFHNYIEQSRKWYKVGQEPYAVKEVYGAMPTHLNGNASRTPRKYFDLFEKYCV